MPSIETSAQWLNYSTNAKKDSFLRRVASAAADVKISFGSCFSQKDKKWIKIYSIVAYCTGSALGFPDMKKCQYKCQVHF